MTNYKKKIKVMHIAECAGGVDRYLYSLLKYLERDDFEVVLVLSKLYEKDKYAELADSIEIIEIPHGMGIKTLLSATTVRKLIGFYKPDVVYAHSSVAGAVGRLANIGMRNVCIYNPHGWSFNMHTRKKKVFILLERFLSFFCDAIVCISDAERKSALSNKICNEDKIEVIYNGIEVEECKDEGVDRETLGIPKEAFVVGMVGRISKQKAPDIFVKMAAEIVKYKKNAFFIIVGDVVEGDMEERQYICKLAEELGIELMITGWVNNPLDYVRQFDVACLLSRWEGFGLVIPEYMLCEKPIVATRVDAIPYLITDRQNGMLVDMDDYEEAARKILEIEKDDKLKNELVCNGCKIVKERFDIKRVEVETKDLIYRLFEQKSRSLR